VTSTQGPSSYRGGSGEPLVLIHGGGGTWHLWTPVIPLLEPHFDLLAVTLAGHRGGAPLPIGRTLGIDGLVDGVERDMDSADFRTAHLVGGSLGGWVALELARRGRASSVVAIAPGGGWSKGSRDWRRIEWMYRVLRVGGRLLARRPYAFVRRPRLRRLLFRHHFARPERMHPDYGAQVILALANCPGFDDFVAWGRAHGGARDLGDVDCPVLLAFPTEDRILPRRRYGEKIIAAIDQAETVDLPGVGHAAMSDDPALVARTISRFAGRHSMAR
jgi:pimeloyl-ACP methyl ester carboxylesterase